MLLIVALIIVAVAIIVSVAHSRAAKEAGEESGVGTLTKILLGVVLPLMAFVLCLGLILTSENAKGPDFGTVAGFKLLFVLLPGIPAILITNSLLMARIWKSVRNVCLIGCILPACLVIVYLCFVAVSSSGR